MEQQAQPQARTAVTTASDEVDRYRRTRGRIDSELARQAAGGREVREDAAVVFGLDDVTVRYGSFPAIRHVSMQIRERMITALIGPSGCGKTTLLRCFNRMNDLIASASVEGVIRYKGADLYAANVDPVEVRRRIGMVFQKPNPFPKSIRENVLFGPKVTRMSFDADEIVERSLRAAALWDEVKDKLDTSALGLSGGQQQRLCIARAIAVEPDTILMDEPCSALDPIATGAIEELMRQLREDYTIVIVTHNMQQAARACDMTAFITTEVQQDVEGHDRRSGRLIEFDRTEVIFGDPSDARTEDYISGRFG
ncbi:MAG TPA: phosphate ABC transporter ATP-binding protein PstB [Euzebyales bacterium]|nr:phosphate ABC transporter ATP-binding protein PstB [Euzebyales bacterium]